jgi:RNA-binding protein YhbY
MWIRFTGKLPPFRLFKYPEKPPLSSKEVIEMKMDIAKLTLNEVEALAERLHTNNVSTVIQRVGDRLVLDVSRSERETPHSSEVG